MHKKVVVSLLSYLLAVFFFAVLFQPDVSAADPAGSRGNPISVSDSSYNSVTNLLKTSIGNRESKCRVYVKKSNTSVDLDVVLEAVKQAALAVSNSTTIDDYLSYHTSLLRASRGDDGGVAYFQFHMLYLDTPEEESFAATKTTEVLQSLSLSGMTQYQKIKKIRDYFVQNVTLNYSYKYGSVISTLDANGASPLEIAYMAYRLYRATNIQSRVITGNIVDSNNNQRPHAWNIVKIGSYWYNIDIASDMVFIQNTPTSEYIQENEDKCFLQDNANFTNHIRDPEYDTESFNTSFPMTSKAYNAGSRLYNCDVYPYRTLGRF